ncbi:PLA2G15 [Scenedesmus sp. PABB004]|nr:PLA2G15 [Scenedesmus sp. PABB004]
MASSLRVRYTPPGTPPGAPSVDEGQFEALLLSRARGGGRRPRRRPRRGGGRRRRRRGGNASGPADTPGAAGGAPRGAAAADGAPAPGLADCPNLPVDGVSLWLPSATLARLAPACWRALLRMRAAPAGAAGAAAAGGGARGRCNFGYARGTNLFVLPYDFRQDPATLEASGQLGGLAAAISRGVARAGRRKAVLLGHSEGSVVALKLLRSGLIRDQVQGFLALAPPWGGSPAAIPAAVAGSYDYLLPWLAPELGAVLGADDGDGGGGEDGTLNAAARRALHAATRGMPSVAALLPYAEAMGAASVSVNAGNVTYTTAQLDRLLADTGEAALAEAYGRLHQLPALVAGGPISGVRTFCLFGATADTPLSWVWDAPLTPGAAVVPRVGRVGKGDGVVPLQSLRLCGSLATSAADIFELPGRAAAAAATAGACARAAAGGGDGDGAAATAGAAAGAGAGATGAADATGAAPPRRAARRR